jgi:hypothetical protein
MRAKLQIGFNEQPLITGYHAMTYQIQVENIKCGGCAKTIRTTIGELAGIDSVDVDIAEGMVSSASPQATTHGRPQW